MLKFVSLFSEQRAPFISALQLALFPIKKTYLKFKITDLKQTQILPKNRPKTDSTAKKTDLCIMLSMLFVLLKFCVKHCSCVKNCLYIKI